MTPVEGEEYSITTTAVDGYKLLGWLIVVEHDGEMSHIQLDTAVATLTATANVVDDSRSYTVVAVFETSDIYADSMTVITYVNDPQMDRTDPKPGVYHYGLGDMIYIIAEPNEGYELLSI